MYMDRVRVRVSICVCGLKQRIIVQIRQNDITVIVKLLQIFSY